MRTPKGYILACLLLTGCMVTMHELNADDVAKEKFARALQQNADQLRQYMWTSRTEIKLKGDAKGAKLESIRYDENGQLARTEIARGSDKQVNSDFAALLVDLGRLARSYAHMTAERKQGFAEKATMSKGEGPMQGTIELQASTVFMNDDHVTIWVDPSSSQLRLAKVSTVYQGNPVQLTISYEMLAQGINYPARATLEYPKKQLELVVENSDYRRLQSVSACGAAERVMPGTPDTSRNTTAAPIDPGWPRQTVRDGVTLVTYQ